MSPLNYYKLIETQVLSSIVVGSIAKNDSSKSTQNVRDVLSNGKSERAKNITNAQNKSIDRLVDQVSASKISIDLKKRRERKIVITRRYSKKRLKGMSSTARTGGKIATQWRCNHCKKYLSSKRSYREHMNVHSERRPFQCDECEYAAASQMTLRRHRLRLHIPRSEWGYPCPYCSEVYMEPASYEQHVSRRHFGQSCTYGCPHQSCNFTSKSSRHFLEHISRHHMVIISSQSNMPPFPDNLAPDSIKASYYLIDDEIGSGYGKPPLEAEIRRYDDVLSLTTAKTRAKPNTKVKPANTVPTAKVVSPIPNQSRARRKITIEEEPKSLSTEISYEEAEDVTEIEEIIYEEIPEIDEVVEEEHYYEIVDENGISIDQFYELDPEADYATEFIDESMNNEVVEIQQAVANKTSVQIDKNNEKRLLPDGQVDIDLD